MTKSEISSQQALLYAGAVGTAGMGLAALADNGAALEKLYSKNTGTTADSVGRKMLHWHAVNSLGLSALQAISAHEKPSVKMLSACGAGWCAAGALQGIHTFHSKAIAPEVGGTMAVVSLALGGAMIGRAIAMHRDKDATK